MKLKVFILCITALMLSGKSYSQEISADSITFSNNKRNKSKYLSRFVSTGSLDSAAINEQMRLLRTLPGVYSVSYNIDTAQNRTILDYSVEEQWTLYPTGDFAFAEDKSLIGFGFMNSNFLKRGIYYYWLFSIESINTKKYFHEHIIIRHSYISGSKFGGEFEFKNKYQDVTNDKYLNSYRIQETKISGLYEIKFENNLKIGFNRKIYLAGGPHRNFAWYSSDLEIEPANCYFIQHSSQKMDFHGMQQDGWKNELNIEYKFYTNGNKVYIVENEYTIFKTWYKTNFAGRIIVGYSNESKYYYQPFYIDNYETIRGAGSIYARGNSLSVANLECRYSLIENRWAGVQLVGFIDGGHAGLHVGGEYQSTNVVYAGVGTRLVYKKGHDAVISIDYAHNMDAPYNKEWLITWGQYF